MLGGIRVRISAWEHLLCIVALLATAGTAWALTESTDVPIASTQDRAALEAQRWIDRPPSTRKAPYLIYSGVNTEMDVHWQLGSISGCTIEWGTDTQYSLGHAFTTEYGMDHQHRCTITGLTPGTLYYYRVTVGGEVHTGSFHASLPDDATQLKFLAYGDTRTYPAAHDSVASAMVSTFTSDPGYQTFALVVGDLVTDGDLEAHWSDQFFDPTYTGIQTLLRDIPYLSAMGNHEESGVLFQKYFPYPFVGGRYWSYDYGPVHFVVVDQYTSYSTGSAQLTWIENDLASSTKPWKIMDLHEPGWSAAGGHSNEVPVQTYLQPLCEQYGVPIIFGGHNHYYARAVVNGVQHVTTGGGGAPLRSPDPSYPHVVETAEEHHYCKIAIDGWRLDFEAVTPDGAVLDSFTIERAGVPEFTWADHYASEIDYFGEAISHTILENTGVATDTITVDIEHEIVPDGVGPYDWIGFYCDTSGACHFGPWDYVLEPGAAETFDVHILDNVGNVQGMALTTLSAAGATDTATVSFATFVDLPSILLVDDDAGGTYETYLQTAIEDVGLAARSWDADALGRPGLGQLSSYWVVLWTTANGSAAYIDADDEQDMADYLDGGGNLMLASMQYLSSRGATNTFITDYLHIDSWSSDTGGFIMTGVSGDPISDQMLLPLLSGPFPSGNSDSIVPDASADSIFTSPTGIKGVRVAEGDHKIVFLSFPFEDIRTSEPDPNNQKTLVERVLNWFDQPSGIEGGEIRRLALSQNVPNPFRPKTEIAFTVPERAGCVTLAVHNVNGQVVRTLLSRELPAGPSLVVWDGRDDDDRPLASGIYFARLAAGGESVFRKMTLLK